MPTSYDKAHADDTRAITALAYEFNPDLAKAGVTISVLWASSDLSVRGMPAHAYAKITGKRERTQGVPDATIAIRKESWDDFDSEQRRALVHHEALHLCPQKDDEEAGGWALDDNLRPKLKMRKHDAEVGFFWGVVKAHGPDAIESIQFVKLRAKMEQLLLDFGG